MELALTLDAPPLATDVAGSVRIGGTRITLDSIVAAFDEGAGAEEIALRFPTLDLADVYSTLAYVVRHRAEVDAYLAERRQLAAELRAEAEHRWPTAGLRERLLARRSA